MRSLSYKNILIIHYLWEEKHRPDVISLWKTLSIYTYSNYLGVIILHKSLSKRGSVSDTILFKL